MTRLWRFLFGGERRPLQRPPVPGYQACSSETASGTTPNGGSSVRRYTNAEIAQLQRQVDALYGGDSMTLRDYISVAYRVALCVVGIGIGLLLAKVCPI